MDQVKKTDGIDKISPQLYIASLDAACCSVPVQIVAFEPESDFIVQPWMSGSNVSELKKGQTVVGSKITAKAGDKISFFGQEYEVAGKLEETGTSYDNCAFMNFETAYTLFDSFQIKYVTDLTEPQKYVSLLTIRTKDGADPKEVANTINTKMRDSGLKAYTAKAMSGKVSDTLEQMQSYSALLIGLLFLMAVLALICIFNITVNERLKEFGVLLSIGARKSQIFQMLLLEAGMIGVLGGFLGVVFSGGGILLFKDVIMESMNMPYLNVNVSQYVILALQSLGLAVGVSLLATLYAAVRANRMELYKLIQEVES
jgi:putative ABC transport system permease protein